jgi:hypothetical protein
VHELRLHLFHLFNKNTRVCKVNLNQTREIEKALVLVGVGCNIVSEKYLMHDDEEDLWWPKQSNGVVIPKKSKGEAFSSRPTEQNIKKQRFQ